MTGQKTDSNSRYRACFALPKSGSKLNQHQDVVEQINAVTKPPQSHVLEEKSCAACRQLPRVPYVQAGCKAPKDSSQTSHLPPQNSSAAGASLKLRTWYSFQQGLVEKPHRILMFLAKYYLYFGFLNGFLRAELGVKRGTIELCKSEK